MRRLFWLAAAVILLTGCGAPAQPQETPVTRQIIAMDTAMTFSVYGQDAEDIVQAAVEEVQRLEKLLDRTDPDSQVTRLNANAGEPVETEREVYDLIAAAVRYSEQTEGCFDITVAPVMDAWGFTTDHPHVPAKAELTELLPLTDSGLIALQDGVITLGAGQSVDLGGIAKGYASDCLAELFARHQAERGWVSLGGNVLAWGTRPDGTPWRVGVQDPRHPDQERSVGLVGLENAFAVTSGGYQRYFEEDGAAYHHIIDPSTGYPADSGLISVTVVAETDGTLPGRGAMCDALSTALFVMGEERALEFYRGSGLDFDLILVTEDDRVLVTAGIAENFTPEEGSGYTYETVS